METIKSICTVIVFIEIWCIVAGFIASRLFRFAKDEYEGEYEPD